MKNHAPRRPVPEPRRTNGRRSFVRLFYRCLGYGSLALGGIGMFLPLMPTTVFILIAAWSFGKSNPELVERLEAHPRYGPPLLAWRKERAIPRNAKAAGIVALVVSFLISLFTIGNPWVLAVLAVLLSAVALFLLTRPAPKTISPRSGSTDEPD